MKKFLLSFIALVVLMSIIYAAPAGKIKIMVNVERYIVIIDNKLFDPADEGRASILVVPGRHEVVIRTRGGKEVYRETINVKEKKTTIVRLHK